MVYAKMGRSNLSVSRICLGTMHFGGIAEEAECFRIMDSALEMGINFFDTANVYGTPAAHGLSEEIVGRWLARDPRRREQVVLATKVYGQMIDENTPPNEERGISAYKMRRHLADSLRRLKTDHIDLRISPEEYWETFAIFINRGDVIYAGTSNFPGWGLVKYQTHARHHGMLEIVSEQSQYNLLSRGPEMEVIPAAQDLGVGILPYMPLGGGLLAGGKRKATEGTRTAQVEREYSLKLAEDRKFEDFAKLCREIGEKESAVAIAWVLANPAVYSAIVGIRTVEQLTGLDRASLQTRACSECLCVVRRGKKTRRLQAGASPKAHGVPAPIGFLWWG